MDKISKFELTKIIGVRATQLSKGAPPMIDIGDLTCAMDIAIAEYRQKVIPFLIIRNLPDGTFAEIDPNDDKYREGTASV